MSFHDVHSTLNTCERTVLESFEGGVDQTYLQQLGQLPFFHPVNLTELFAEGRVLNVNKHGIVFLQGEVGNFAFVVLRGSVDLYYQSDEHVEVALRSHLGAIMNDKRDLVPIESFRHLLGKTLCCLQVRRFPTLSLQSIVFTTVLF